LQIQVQVGWFHATEVDENVHTLIGFIRQKYM